jgi:hypothetical protein
VRFVMLAVVIAGCAQEADPPPRPAACAPGPLATEAGFLEVGNSRLFYSFHPADDAPESRPLAVFFNGGPGAATAPLLTLHTAPRALDPDLSGSTTVGDNPYSWTRFANLLHIDAPRTGFSYDVGESPPMDPTLDADMFDEAVLDFLDTHAPVRCNPVILVGESYGGMRATLMLDLLLGAAQEPLAAHLATHVAATEEPAAAQFAWQVLIQPLVVGDAQEEAQAALAPPKPDGADPYNVSQPDNWSQELEGRITGAVTHVDTLEALLGIDPRTIPPLAPAARAGVRRCGENEPFPCPPTGDLDAVLGALAPNDTYFMLEAVFFVPGGNAKQTLGDTFLRNLRTVHTFITNAALDAVIWSPAIPTALATLPSVAAIDVGDGTIDVTYADTAIGRRRIRFPSYAQSGHMVSASQPAELAADVTAWWHDTTPHSASGSSKN